MGSVRNKEDIKSWCFKIRALSSLWSSEHQNLPSTLNQRYMAPNGGYVGPNLERSTRFKLGFCLCLSGIVWLLVRTGNFSSTYMSFAVSLAFELQR